jgi:hypothetical protein
MALMKSTLSLRLQLLADKLVRTFVAVVVEFVAAD